MDPQEFREHGKTMVDYIADYWETIRDRHPIPDDVKPGYIWDTLPPEAPNNKETWKEIFGDLDNVVTDKNAHWMHPHFYAYYPSANSYPSIIADMLANGIGGRHMNWESSPACAELESVVIDWLAKSIGLPPDMLNSTEGDGGGMIVGTASEGILTALLAARTQMYNKMGADVIPKLVAYSSDQAHSSIERAALLAGITIKKLKTAKDNLYGLTANTFLSAVMEDLSKGLIPFFLCACIGTTSSCAIDNVADLVQICSDRKIWLHVDAAYAASAVICPEYRHLMAGVETVDSFSWNPHKWLLMHFECSTLWLKDMSLAKVCTHQVHSDLKLQLEQHELMEPKEHQIQMSRRFRALKIWMVMRRFGIQGLQKHIRSTCKIAEHFANHVSSDPEFQMFVPVTLGLACFRIKGENDANEKLVQRINDDKRIHLVPSKIEGVFFLRLAVCSPFTTEPDIDFAWKVIKELSASLKEL